VLGLCLAVGIGLLVVWAALGVAFYSTWPVGFFVSTFGFAVYMAAIGVRLATSRWSRPVDGTASAPVMAPPGMATT
jgi:zinc/manganese transport system permease protein